jgi:pimeloyl-ACP methyl ester carboxylesterase
MNSRRFPQWFFHVAWILLFIVSCNADPEPAPTPSFESRLATATLTLTRPASELRNILGFTSLDLPVESIQYNTEMYAIEYTTTYKGEEIVASGMVFLPVAAEDPVDFPLISFQHGTIASNSEAPSQLSISNEQNILYAGMAGAGFVIVVPDYIGFGSSVHITHPYYVEEPTAQAIMDMIRAGGELALENGLSLSNHLYLAGYSQGGYATLAAHKQIEEEGVEWYQLQKSYPSSGGYDVVGMRDYFFSLDTYHQPFFLAYVAEAYRTYYDWDKEQLQDMFNEPYAGLIPTLFDGSFTGSQVNDQLNDTLSVLVRSDYLSNPEGSQFDFIEDAFAANALLDWTPEITIEFFHGDADITVPYQNSVDSYDHFISTGSSPDVISLTTLPDATHGGGFIPYLELLLNDLVEQEGL